MTNQPIITISNLKKTYRLAKSKTGQGEFDAVKETTFEVQKGEIFGILGPNGAGKTTTLEIMEGLKKQSSGTVTVLGLDNIKQSDEVKKRIGVQLQSSDYAPYLTLGELLDLFASLYGYKADREKLLGSVDLQDKEHELVKNLSGGQKQRFTIATSLVNQPEILFLDEPTTGLDPAARRSMWNLVKQLNAQGITIVLTTHYMEEAEFLCHRVAIMDKGQILKIDEPRKLIDQLSNIVQVSFLTDQKIHERKFSDLSGIKKVYNQAPKILIEVENLEKVPAIIEFLKTSHISFSGFTVKTASLEDVYLQLTGHQYQTD